MSDKNTPPAADAVVKEVVDKIDGLKSGIDSKASITDVQALQKSVNDLSAKVDTLASDKPAQPKWSVPAECRGVSLRAFKSHEQAFACVMTLMGQAHEKYPNFRSPLTAKAHKWSADHGYIAKGTNQVEGINSQGGFLVFDQNSTEIIDLKEDYGVFQPNVRVIPMSSDHYTQLRRTGGTTVYPVDELGSITPSNKAWDKVTLTPKKFAQMVRYSSEINEDAAVALVDDLVREMKYQFDLKIDQCGFVGDGTSTYGGMQGVATKINGSAYTASVSTAATGHTGFDTLTLTDFHNLIGLLPKYALPNAKFYCSQAAFAVAMQRLAAAGGGNTMMNLQGQISLSFLGFPVVISQVLNSTLGADASKIKLLFGDLKASTFMGLRRGMTVATSTEKYFDTDELAIRATMRWDINAHDLGSTSVAGPILALKTPAS